MSDSVVMRFQSIYLKFACVWNIKFRITNDHYKPCWQNCLNLCLRREHYHCVGELIEGYLISIQILYGLYCISSEKEEKNNSNDTCHLCIMFVCWAEIFFYWFRSSRFLVIVHLFLTLYLYLPYIYIHLFVNLWTQ